MKAQGYVRKAGLTYGLASTEEFKKLLESKRLSLDHDASQSPGGPWRPLGEWEEFIVPRPIRRPSWMPPRWCGAGWMRVDGKLCLCCNAAAEGGSFPCGAP